MRSSPLTRRGFLGRLAGAAAAGSLPRSLLGRPRSGDRPPNVLFIMADDMRVELGCYGSRLGSHTPHLDALAAESVRFDRNFCQFPLCNPSRASLLTNRHPTTTRVLGNRTNFRDLHPDWISLPQLFRLNGYDSLRIGKIFHDIYDDPKAWTVGGMVPLLDGGLGGTTLPILRAPPASLVPAASARMRIVGRAEEREPDYRSADFATAYVLPAMEQDNRRAEHSDRIVVLDGKGEGHPDYYTADVAIRYLEEYRERDRPFFLGCGFVKPHSPPCATRELLDRYPPGGIPLPPDFATWPTVPPGFPSAAIRRHNADLFIGRGSSPAAARQVISAYLAAIAFTDWNVGRVLAALDRLGLRENTLVVFLADHGYQLGEKGKWSKAGSLFEMGTRVPLMISVPGSSARGRTCRRITQSIDLYSTLAELCRLPLPPGGEGTSLAPLLRDPDSPWDRPAYSVWSEDGRTLHGTAVRTERWRYAEFGPEGVHGAMLFDRRADPRELVNLAYDPRHAPVCAELSPLARRYASRLGRTQA
jgi:arylsulfatase A-like enzyme